MYRYFIVLFIILINCEGANGFSLSRPNGSHRKIIIAVPDTGYTAALVPNLSICSNGLIDLTGTGMQDDIGHGTNILNIIAHELKDVDYCVYVYKIYNKHKDNSAFYSMLAYMYMSYLPALDIVNYSSSGKDEMYTEKLLISHLTNKNIKFVAAAGNDNRNLDINCAIFPACYKDVISVGALDIYGQKAPYSNYGKIVKAWQLGDFICFNNACMSGTSQATAYETTVLAKKLYYGK